MHTVINTSGGVAGAELRSHPLPDAYDFVQSMSDFLDGSPYQKTTDLAFVVAYALLATDDKWEDTVEAMILKSPRRYRSLEEAFRAVFPHEGTPEGD